MATGSLVLTIKLAWWVPIYVHSLVLFCRSFNTEPDFDKVMRVLVRGIVVIRI